MEANPKDKPAETALAPTRGSGLAPLPPEIEDEEKLAKFAAEENLARMAIVDPDKVEKALQALARVLKTMREIAVQDTVGIDWTLYKDRDGNEVAVLRDSGAVKARKWLGISIYGHRPDDGSPGEGPRIYDESVPQGEGQTKKVQVVAGLADGTCGRTGESIHGVYFAVRNEPQEFTGRKDEKTKLSNVTDLLSTWRTGIDAKVVRILGSLRKVPIEELRARGVDVAKCYKGRGYGTSAERSAAGAAAGGIAEEIGKLRQSIVRRTGGDNEAGKKLVREITSRPPNPKKAGDKGFAGLNSLDQMTLGWQVDKAFEKLRSHPVFGNKALGWPEGAEDPPVGGVGDAGSEPPENGAREPGGEG